MSLVRKHQIQDWSEVLDAQQTATGAATAAGTAQTAAETAQAAADAAEADAQAAATSATAAQTTANGKIAGFVQHIRIFSDNDLEVGQTEFTAEAGEDVVVFSDIVDVELYENGVCNDDATVTYVADIRPSGQGPSTVQVTVFTVTGLDNGIFAGDKFKFKIAVKNLPVPN